VEKLVDKDRRREIDEVFTAVLRQPPDQREQYLARTCRDDKGMLAAVRKLLEAYQRAGRQLEASDEQPAPPTVDAEPRFAGRFSLLRKLGAGSMGVVYAVRDWERGEAVALKMLRYPDPDKLYRLKREFRALAGLDHINLVTLHELLADDDSCFYTMELIEGSDLITYVKSRGAVSGRLIDSSSQSSGSSPVAGPITAIDPASTSGTAYGSEAASGPDAVWPTCDEGRLRHALPQLVRGLVALHKAGKVHRDIKPSNIMVEESGRLVLLDFGLVTQLDDEPSLEGQLIGTAPYMAPEQCSGGQLTPAADWYAVGAVLYQALTGWRPYSGSIAEIVLAKQRSTPAPPRALVLGVPRDLDELCVDLLARDPAQRPTAAEILRRLGAELTSAPIQLGETRTTLFAGRREELHKLSRGLATVAGGDTAITLVCGDSGIGKSTLIHRFLEQERSRHTRLVVLQGRCYDRETVPYQAIDSLIDNLSRHWCRLTPIRAAELVPREASLLPRLFPVLGRVPAVASAPRSLDIVNLQELRTRAFAALRETLQRLGERSLLVLFLDDMQWADSHTLVLLSDLMRPPDPPRMLLVLAGRPEACETLTELMQANESGGEVLFLQPLPHHDALELASTLLAHGTTDLAERVAAEADGNPFFIIELARYLQTGDHTLATVRLGEVLSQRILGLSEAARQVLEIVALAGAQVTRRTLHRALGLTRADLAHELSTLRVQKLVRTSGRWRDRLEPFHDRIRDAILSSLSESSRRAHHRSLALALEGEASAEQLAYHWRGAEEGARAAEHAQTAAETAQARFDFDRAATLYQMALSVQEHEPDHWRALTIAMAEALVNAGRPAEAAEAFTLAAQGADPEVKLALTRCSAEQLIRAGYLTEGLREMNEVLAAIGYRLARTPKGALLSLLLRRSLLRLHGLRWRERSPSDLTPRVVTRIDVCWSAAYSLGFVDLIRGSDYQSRHLLMALRAGDRKRIGRALALEAWFLAGLGARRARKVNRLVQELATDTEDPFFRALAIIARGFVSYYLDNDWKSARHWFEEADQLIIQRFRRQYELDATRMMAIYSRIYGGQLAELTHSVPAFALAAERRGDRHMAVNIRARANIIWLVRDDVAGAQAVLERSRGAPVGTIYQLQHYFTLLAGCDLALYCGHPEQAATQMQDAIAPLRWSQLLHSRLARLEITNLQVRIALARAAAASPVDRAPLMREVRRHLRRLRRMPPPLARALYPAFRAGMAHLDGDRATTEACLRRAVSALEDLETMLYANVAKRRLAQTIGGGEGAALHAESERWMAGQEVANPERMTAMLIPGWPADQHLPPTQRPDPRLVHPTPGTCTRHPRPGT
jgi:serine/threonine protein kinase